MRYASIRVSLELLFALRFQFDFKTLHNIGCELKLTKTLKPFCRKAQKKYLLSLSKFLRGNSLNEKVAIEKVALFCYSFHVFVFNFTI
jgi:hypothetical protein